VLSLRSKGFLWEESRALPGRDGVAEYSGEEKSPEKRRLLGHISKQGNVLLRFLLVEAAQVTLRSQQEWQQFFHLAMRRGRKIAKVAMALLFCPGDGRSGGQLLQSGDFTHNLPPSSCSLGQEQTDGTTRSQSVLNLREGVRCANQFVNDDLWGICLYLDAVGDVVCGVARTCKRAAYFNPHILH
jgi:hypothetical protein